ncbi:tRNA (adenosine(37)-N6)-threonylcarbamoyltransferase complex ATPase subunit type 1 TsaE [Candidatus Dependentiae bacterium]
MWSAEYQEKDIPKMVKEIFLPLVEPGSIFALEGPLGAGKTALVGEVLRQKGVEGPVQSPTFAYFNKYLMKNGVDAYHFDLYRLGAIDEFCAMGFDEILENKDCVTFIEWPKIVFNFLDKLSFNRKIYKVVLSYSQKNPYLRQIFLSFWLSK